MQEGQEFLTSGVDDGLFQAIYTTDGTFDTTNFVSAVRVVCARGQATTGNDRRGMYCPEV